jgi:hypothetical protein
MLRACALAGAVAASLLPLASCAEVGTGPSEPASIEFTPFPSPSVVVGDTLRDLEGRVAPVRALLRNIRGEVIEEAQVRYLYADFARDTALAVDSATGIVRALKASRGSNGDARIAARAGASLQVIRSLIVTLRPDSIDGQRVAPLFTTQLPDTGRVRAQGNTTPELSVTVRHIASATSVTGVNAWPVRFELVRPANPTNDTTAAVFLVDDQGRPSTLDTTNTSGTAGRRVRVRAALFPTGTAVDSIIVKATARYRGQLLRGDSVRIAVPVRRQTSP